MSVSVTHCNPVSPPFLSHRTFIWGNAELGLPLSLLLSASRVERYGHVCRPRRNVLTSHSIRLGTVAIGGPICSPRHDVSHFCLSKPFSKICGSKIKSSFFLASHEEWDDAIFRSNYCLRSGVRPAAAPWPPACCRSGGGRVISICNVSPFGTILEGRPQ